MDAQQIEAAWLFPTLGVMYEEALKHDPEAVGVAFRAFNRWLDEDWGLHSWGSDSGRSLHFPRRRGLGRGGAGVGARPGRSGRVRASGGADLR